MTGQQPDNTSPLLLLPASTGVLHDTGLDPWQKLPAAARLVDAIDLARWVADEEPDPLVRAAWHGWLRRRAAWWLDYAAGARLALAAQLRDGNGSPYGTWVQLSARFRWNARQRWQAELDKLPVDYGPLPTVSDAEAAADNVIAVLDPEHGVPAAKKPLDEGWRQVAAAALADGAAGADEVARMFAVTTDEVQRGRGRGGRAQTGQRPARLYAADVGGWLRAVRVAAARAGAVEGTADGERWEAAYVALNTLAHPD